MEVLGACSFSALSVLFRVTNSTEVMEVVVLSVLFQCSKRKFCRGHGGGPRCLYFQCSFRCLYSGPLQFCRGHGGGLRCLGCLLGAQSGSFVQLMEVFVLSFSCSRRRSPVLSRSRRCLGCLLGAQSGGSVWDTVEVLGACTFSTLLGAKSGGLSWWWSKMCDGLL